MNKLTWTQACFSLMLLLQVTAVTGQNTSSIAVRAGDDVTLSCAYVIDGQHECNGTDWSFSGSKLVRRGKIDKEGNPRSDRLSLTESCSLVLQKVSDGDVGLFECQQIRSGRRFHFTEVYLSVVSMTVHDDGDVVTLTCSVSALRDVTHIVQWLYEGEAVRGHTKSATVTFPSSELSKKKSYQCQVTDDRGHEFTFPAPTSGEEPDVDTTTTTTTNGGTPGMDQTAPSPPYVAAVAGAAAALLTAAVVLLMWKRRKGRRTQTGQDAENLQQPDPEEEVSYASVSYIQKQEAAGAQAPVRGGNHGDEGDNVTYSTVKVSSSSAHPSSDVYATVNQPRN